MLIYWGIPYFTSNSIWIHRSIQLVLGISASRRGCSQQFWEALLVSPRCQPWLIVKKGVGEDVAMLIFTKNPAAMGRNSTLIAQLFSSSEWTIRLDRWAAPLASHHLEETLAAQKKSTMCIHVLIRGKSCLTYNHPWRERRTLRESLLGLRLRSWKKNMDHPFPHMVQWLLNYQKWFVQYLVKSH